MRVIFEFIVIIAVVLIARALLTSVLAGVARASSQSFPQQGPGPKQSRRPAAPQNDAGELHKDPICGTYVAEGSTWQRRVGGQTFYYCSASCCEKHSLVAR